MAHDCHQKIQNVTEHSTTPGYVTVVYHTNSTHIICTTQHYDNHLDIIGGMHYIVVTLTLLEHLYCGCTSCGHIHTNYGEDWRGKQLSTSYFVCSICWNLNI